MSIKKRLAVSLICLVFIFGLIDVPAHAESQYVQPVSIANYLLGHLDSDFAKIVLSSITLGLAGCSVAEDGRHRSVGRLPSPVLDPYSEWFGYYFCTCDLCGLGFYAPPSEVEEAAESAYDTYVSELPATGIDSSGKLILYPSLPGFYYNNGNSRYFYDPSYLEYDPAASSSSSNFPLSGKANYTFDREKGTIAIWPLSGSSDFGSIYSACFSLAKSTAPVSGTYTYHDGSTYAFARRYDNVEDSGTHIVSRSNTPTHYDSGATLRWSNLFIYNSDFSVLNNGSVISDLSYFSMSITALPYYEIVPSSGIIDTQTDTTYNVNTRAGSITGDYGILGDNNEIIKADTTSIVNETDNSVYNPVTNTTTSYDSYSYDYSDRSYTFSKTDGNTTTTTTVTYGDENITIQEGDTVYNVYYIYQAEAEDPEPSPSPSSGHSHNYSGSITQEPTCTLTGLKTFTCECGNSYTQTVAALGHNWEIKTQVPTEYDENGELVTQGYTIYRCSRCGEEYKSEDGTAPPAAVSPGGELADPGALEEFRQKLISFFSAVPQMFGDLSDFLVEGWSYIPEEVTWFIKFGFGMAVLLALWRLFWR